MYQVHIYVVETNLHDTLFSSRLKGIFWSSYIFFNWKQWGRLPWYIILIKASMYIKVKGKKTKTLDECIDMY